MEYNETNWNECIKALGFKEIKSLYGCYDILNDKGIPTWQYDINDIEKKMRLFDFFCGCLYMKNHY